MMKRCWEQDPKLRPGFSELVQSIDKDLQGMTDYIFVSAFSLKRAANPQQDHWLNTNFNIILIL